MKRKEKHNQPNSMNFDNLEFRIRYIVNPYNLHTTTDAQKIYAYYFINHYSATLAMKTFLKFEIQ